jgi:hypothetical protein
MTITPQAPHRSEETGRVLPFRPRARWRNEKLRREAARSPVPDLSKFSGLPEEDDYRQRMRMNLAAFLVLAAMVWCGIWIADNISQRSRDQDCASIGRTGCAPIPAPAEAR